MFLDARNMVVIALCVVPTAASAQEATTPSRAAVHATDSRGTERGVSRRAKTEKKREARPCVKPPVDVVAGGESATISLARCDGAASRAGVDELSILARPAGTEKPKQSLVGLGKVRGREIAPGIRRMDVRLVERMELVIDHFRQAGATPRVEIVSAVRTGPGSPLHGAGRAIDFRVAGVDAQAVVNYCKTLPDTGCGFYPSGGFAHLDVRDPGSGKVSWIDVSRPGERPHYVASLPAERPTSRSSGNLPALPAARPDTVKPDTSEPAAAVLAVPTDGAFHGM
jgi:hypothetical protein